MTSETIIEPIKVHADALSARVREVEGGGYRLEWTDGVCQEEEETYETLPAALARLGALVHCAETGGAAFFTTDERTFARQWDAFLAGVAA